MAINGTIKLHAKTNGHAAWLTARGYTAKVEGEAIQVTGNGAFLEVLDLSGPDAGVEALRQVIARGDLLTYSTKVRFPDGKVLFSTPACTRLGAASALVVKPARGTARTGGTNVYDSI